MPLTLKAKASLAISAFDFDFKGTERAEGRTRAVRGHPRDAGLRCLAENRGHAEVFLIVFEWSIRQ
jgi:hypothetical protein